MLFGILSSPYKTGRGYFLLWRKFMQFRKEEKFEEIERFQICHSIRNSGFYLSPIV